MEYSIQKIKIGRKIFDGCIKFEHIKKKKRISQNIRENKPNQIKKQQKQQKHTILRKKQMVKKCGNNFVDLLCKI